MRYVYALMVICFVLPAFGQNPLIIKSVGGTVLEPKNKDQNIWMNNEWNGKFFYQGTGTPLKLCVTDGTTAGTQLLKDINADFFQFTIPAQNFIYIITERTSGVYPNLQNNVEIWKSDGTSAGTVLVKALPPFNPFNSSQGVSWTSDKNLKFNYSVVGDVMYFMGWDAANGKELWRTDGTDAGTYMVKDIRTGTANSNPSSFCALGSDVYFFAAAVNLEQKLWKTDGTAAGTVQVAVPEPFFAVPYVGKVGNKMIFFANNTIHGIEPWVSDGTPAGTFMLADINPGAGNGTPGTEQNLHLRFNDKYAFMMGNKATGGKSLWRTDGTQAGTIQLTPDNLIAEDNFSGGGYSDINNNFLYWIGGNQKLYRSDGTPGGTTRITTALYNALYMKIYKNAAWFHARNADNVSNGEPYRSDGTAANTKRFDVQPGDVSSYPYGFFVKNNMLYFFCDSYAGRNLYQYTGDMTFNGSVAGGQWSNNANWNSQLTPGITDTVTIPSGVTVTIDGAKGYVGSLLMQSGSTLSLAGTADSLFVHKEISGTTVNGNGTLVLQNFSGDTTKITAPLTASNVNARGTVSISSQLTITNNVNLTGYARLLANSSNVLLSGTTSSISNDASSYIVTNGTGALVVENLGTGGRTGALTFPIGTVGFYNPLTLSNSGTADAFSARVQPGINSVYTNDLPTGGAYTGGAVSATWHINEAVPGGSNASITLQWNAAQELNGFNRSQSQLGHYTGGAWQLGTAGAATGSNPYTWSGGYTSFSPFGILNSNATLPVRALVLQAVKHGNSVLCSWTIAGSFSDMITLERSENGRQFSPVHSVPASSAGVYEDRSPLAVKTYYRLRSTNTNGSSVYSNVVWVTSGVQQPVVLYPTLVSSQFTLQNNRTDAVTIEVFGAGGNLVIRRSALPGTTLISTEVLAKGIYYYQVSTKGTRLSGGQLVKQ